MQKDKTNISLLKDLKNRKLLSDAAYKCLLSEEASNEDIEEFYDMKKVVNKENSLKISIVLITHNRKYTLKRAISNIIRQIYKNYEVIIIDDCSSDNTEQYISEFLSDKISYFYNEKNMGAGESRKKGYLKASGDIIIFSDDDDYYIDPFYFCKLNAIFGDDSSVNIVCSNTLIKDEDNGKYYASSMRIKDGISNKEYINGFSTIYDKPNSSFSLALRQSAMQAINYRNLPLFNDTSLYLYALLANGTVGVIDEYIGVYCVHSGNMSLGVSPEFIIKNLDSKKIICQLADEKGLLINAHKWLYDQSKITLNYYFNGSSKGLHKDLLLLKWVIQNEKGYFRLKLVLEVLAKIIKNCVKNIIRAS